MAPAWAFCPGDIARSLSVQLAARAFSVGRVTGPVIEVAVMRLFSADCVNDRLTRITPLVFLSQFCFKGISREEPH